MSIYTSDEFQELLKNGTFKQFEDRLRLKTQEEIESEYNTRRTSLLESGKTKQEIEEDKELKEILLTNDNQVSEKLNEIDQNGNKF
jgi:hypothetical protein